MTDGEILDIAVRQSATDSACRPEDFFKGEHVVVRSRADMGARKYLSLPFALDLASYGNNVVASADEALIPVAKAYLRGRRTEACFETPARPARAGRHAFALRNENVFSGGVLSARP